MRRLLFLGFFAAAARCFSQPRLDCPGRLDLPLDRPMDPGLVLAAFRQSASECRDHWTTRGVDLGSYNTIESARDIDDLRRALGAPKVSLLAGSYGTHLAFAAIRLFEGSIDRAVFFGVSGPDHMERLPGDYQEVLIQIDRMVKRTPLLAGVMPTFLGTVRTVLEKLSRNPERIEGIDTTTGERRTVTLGKFDLHDAVRVGRVRRATGEGSAPVGRLAPRRPGGLPDSGVCDAWAVADLGPDFRAPLSSTVPVLFVSGTLDAHTPAENAREVLAGFRNGQHLLVQDGAHGLLGFSLPKGRKLSAKFLRGESVSAGRLTTPPFGFLVPGLARDAAIASEFGRSLRPVPGYRSGPY